MIGMIFVTALTILAASVVATFLLRKSYQKRLTKVNQRELEEIELEKSAEDHLSGVLNCVGYDKSSSIHFFPPFCFKNFTLTSRLIWKLFGHLTDVMKSRKFHQRKSASQLKTVNANYI